MDRYQDVPMDFADASLMAVIEEDGADRIFTVDSHFHAYRLSNRRVLRILPESV